MKATKMFFGDKRLKDFYVGATKWQVFKYKTMRVLRKIAIFSFIIGLSVGSFKAGGLFSPTKTNTVYADKITEVPTMPDIPVLDRIAKCESSNSQYDKNGQVITHANSNNTVDIGKYQINTTAWGAQAHKLGYDLSTEDGNTKFAQWLYLNHGTEAWYSSKKCWQ